MKRDHGPPVEGAASFHTTYWTIVMRAAQSQAQGGAAALAESCWLYWYRLYIFARRRGHSPGDAQDLTQSFFLHLLERRALSGVDRFKGKFRSFLLASFQNHLDSNNRAAPTYEEVARLELSTGGVKTLIHGLRKRYTALLREEVGRTVSDPLKIDEEIHFLCDAWLHPKDG